MRAICHILRIVGYFSLLPYLAYAKMESFATCVITPGAAGLGLTMAFLTFLCIIGYGNILHGKQRGSSLFFWMTNTLFYATATSLVVFQSGGRIFAGTTDRISRFTDSFFPHYQPNTALFAVGGLAEVFLAVWMPIAALLSLSAFILTIGKDSPKTAGAINKKKTESGPRE